MREKTAQHTQSAGSVVSSQSSFHVMPAARKCVRFLLSPDVPMCLSLKVPAHARVLVSWPGLERFYGLFHFPALKKCAAESHGPVEPAASGMT